MAGIGVGGLPRDARSLTEEEHQEPWTTGNPNKPLVVGSSALKKEKLLLSLGGNNSIEELPEFFLEDRYVNENARITRKNSLIVKKLNGMRVLWTQYQVEVSQEVPHSETKATIRGLSNLMNQIHTLQAEIRNDGGLAYPVPAILENIPDV